MSAIFEFDFIEPKPTTKVDSVFDLVNGNGQHQSIGPSYPLEPKGMQWGDAPPWIAPPAEVVVAEDSPNLTQTDIVEGYSPANHLYQPIDAETKEILTNDETGNGLIVMPDLFEFMQSETLDYNETQEAPVATIYPSNVFPWDDEEDEVEQQHQAHLRKWERDYEQAKLDWDKTKRDTEQEQVSLALEVKRISDELKEVRQQHKSVISFLEDLNKTGPDYPERPIKGQAPKPPAPPAEPAPTKPTKKQPNVDESWKKIKAETFLSLEIEGMGQKKLDTLLHEYPTLGDWVELQTEASKKCMHLSKLLPKGVGKKLADSIDDAVLEAFANHVPQEANT
jgi:hypothetical protein